MNRRSWLAAATLLSMPTLAHAQAAPYTLFDSVPRDALRNLSTDRPDKTESPYTVDAGHVQVELDFAAYTRDRERRSGQDARSETLAIAPINLKIGLTRDTDLQMVVEPYVRQTTQDRTTGAREQIAGIGDVTIRLKHNIWGDDGGRTALAVMPFVKLPTNGNGVGNASVEGGIIAPLAIALPVGFDLGLMTEIDILRDPADTGYTASFVNSATVSHALTSRLGLYVELFTEKTADRDARFVATVDFGLAYALGGDTQFDMGINYGITDAADDIDLFAGLSQRF